MKNLVLLALFLYGCSGGDLSATSNSVAAVSGAAVTYKLQSTTSYYTNNGGAAARVAYFNIDLETLTLNGASYTIVRKGTSCTSTETGTITFDTSNYTYTLSNRSVTNAPSGPCTIAYALTAGQSQYFSPTTWNISINEGALTNFSGSGFNSATRVGFLNSDTVAGDGTAYYLYIKQ